MFRLVERPTLMPACSLLGTTVGPMVDTQKILHQGGRVYLTEVEGWEVVNKFPTYDRMLAMRAAEAGWMSPAEVQALRDRVAEMQAELDAAREAQPRVVPLEDVLAVVNGAAA